MNHPRSAFGASPSKGAPPAARRSRIRGGCSVPLRLFGLAGLLIAGLAQAQTVTLNGSLGERALLVIDGQPRALAVGATVAGVTLISRTADAALIEVGGKRLTLRDGGAATGMGGGTASATGREIVLSAGLGGHFTTLGSINGRTVRFMVDTGATAVAMGHNEADRIGLKYRDGTRLVVGTANGPAPAYAITLSAVRIGDVEVAQVPAVVLPQPMDMVLLGNSFLSRFQMRRDNETMRLEKRL